MAASLQTASKVSVVVVSFNTIDKLRRCLSCVEHEHDLIVVDNGSLDGSVQMVKDEFPHARLIENSGNVGFGAANNQGMELARREFVLFLNSDAYAAPGAISLLAKAMSFDTAAVGGRLLNLDGSIQESVANELTLWAVLCEQTYLEKVFPRSSFFSPYWATPRAEHWDEVANPPSNSEEEATTVTQVMGACLMIKPLERFDERFFLYCEDTEICKRLTNHGAIKYVPGAKFIHELGSSSLGSSRWLSVARYNRGKELYFSIHQGSMAMALCGLLDRLGALFRLIVYLVSTVLTLGLRPQLRSKTALWWKVLTVSPLGPDRPPHKQG